MVYDHREKKLWHRVKVNVVKTNKKGVTLANQTKKMYNSIAKGVKIKMKNP